MVKSEYNSLLANMWVTHIIEPASSSIGKQLQRYSDRNLKNIIVVGSSSFIANIVDHAGRRGLFGPKQTWFALTKVSFIKVSLIDGPINRYNTASFFSTDKFYFKTVALLLVKHVKL